MAKTNRQWVLWFLMIFFIWSVGRDFQLLYTHRRSVNFFIFDRHQLTMQFYAAAGLVFLVDLERQSRGLPANPATADRVFSPEGMMAAMGVSILFPLLGIAALFGVRRFFGPPARNLGADDVQ